MGWFENHLNAQAQTKYRRIVDQEPGPDGCIRGPRVGIANARLTVASHSHALKLDISALTFAGEEPTVYYRCAETP